MPSEDASGGDNDASRVGAIDVDEVAERTGASDLLPLYLLLQEQVPAQPAGLPVPAPLGGALVEVHDLFGEALVDGFAGFLDQEEFAVFDLAQVAQRQVGTGVGGDELFGASGVGPPGPPILGGERRRVALIRAAPRGVAHRLPPGLGGRGGRTAGKQRPLLR